MGRTRPIRLDMQRGLRFGVAAIALCSLGAFSVRAQDVAEAARQEKARKTAAAAQQKSGKHVYSNDDLKRARILTPEEQARVEARKKNSVAPAPGLAPNQPAPSLDATNSNPSAAPAESLGEVARRFRREKAARESEQALKTPPRSGFPLDLSQPTLAAPTPLRAPAVAAPSLKPTRPSTVAMPPGRRDPFSPTFRAQPAPPTSSRVPSLSSIPSPAPVVTPPISHATASRTIAPTSSAINPATPPAAARVVPIDPRANPKASIIIQPGDSLWKVARQHLGRGSRWPEFLAANPALTNPARIRPGTTLLVPQPTARAGNQPPLKISVVKGDSLWKVAQLHLRSGANWPCLAQANPQLLHADRIYPGQILLIPATCGSASRPARRN